MARLGQAYCPACDVPVGTQSADEVIEKLMAHRGRDEALPDGAAGDPRGRAVRDALGAEPGRRLRPHPRRRPDLFGRPAAGNRPAAEAPRRGGGRSRDGAARGPLADRRQRGKRPGPGPRRARARSIPKRACPSRSGPPRPTASISLATVAGGVSSRWVRTISPSTARWAGARAAKGWACRRAPIRRPCSATRSSRWPRAPWRLWPAGGSRLFRAMLEGFARATGVPLDVPFEQLTGKHRRLVMHGAGERWFEAISPLSLRERGRG